MSAQPDEWAYTPATTDNLRDDLATVRRDCATWRAIAHEAIHSLAAQYNRVQQLERHVQEMREERERYARHVFANAPMKEQR
jgi:ABC-type uncharacterized transport system fused permease/ATPase subunit